MNTLSILTLIGLLILSVSLFIYIAYRKNLFGNKERSIKIITSFFRELDSLKEGFIRREDGDKLKEKYRSTYEDKYLWLLFIFGHRQTVKDFLRTYKNLDSIITQHNFYLELEKNKQLVLAFQEELETLKKEYIDYNIREDTKERYEHLYENINKKAPEYTNKKESLLSHEEQVNVFDRFLDIYNNFDHFAKIYNAEFVKAEIEKNSKLFDNINGLSLDEQQRTAVVTDEINNLVVAGAGSGKTLTISAKVKYLVNVKKFHSSEILLISYTKKSAEEMSTRIKDKMGISIDSMTFHKLGLKKITEEAMLKPSIFNQDLQIVFRKHFSEKIESNAELISDIVDFFALYLNIPGDIEKYESLGEYYQTFNSLNFETIKGKYESSQGARDQNNITLQSEEVKSIEELMISNYLFLRNIKYSYEAPYKYATGDQYRGQYRPDFYLPEYGIYIEHFGVTRDGQAPWLSLVEQKKYIEGMEWKRQLHAEKKTPLIETFSFYNQEGVLLEKLEEKLIANDVQIGEVDKAKIYESIALNDKDYMYKEFVRLLTSFMQLFKTNEYGSEKFDMLIANAQKEKNAFNRKRELLFFTIAKSFYEYYEAMLEERDEIDFNDMINDAIKVIKEGKIKLGYKYVIVDEYQDIAANRYKLIKAIKEQTNAKLLCVGDDWQSIYKFAGSDMNLFTHFDDYFGYTEKMKIEKVYRNSQELIDIAGEFVMENPSQITKKLISDRHFSNPLRLIAYERKEDFTKKLKDVIDEIASLFGTEEAILILGRNNFDIEPLKEDGDFEVKEGRKPGKKDKIVKIIVKKYPSLDIDFLTVHRAKGLEANNVIVLNAKNQRNGFPNQITDDPLLRYVLAAHQGNTDRYFPYEEERRLFYVATTRSKNATYILSPVNKESVFITELQKKYDLKLEVDNYKESELSNPKCPKCKTGHLVLRKNSSSGGYFLGCSNYPQDNNTYKDVTILDNTITCTKCQGYMTRRKSAYGEFYGCTNYPYCKNTINIK